MQLEVGPRSYSEIFIGADEVVVVASPVHIAHALINVDSSGGTTFFLGCQDSSVDYNIPTPKIWDDI